MRCALLLMLLASCPPKPPAPTPPALPDAGQAAAATCPRPSDVSGGSACDGMFTAAGLACVRCGGNAGCVDQDLQVYCSAGPCAADPACSLEPEDGALQHRRPKKVR